MRKYFLMLVICFLANSGMSLGAANITRHQIISKDVTELNKLGDALGISGKTGWPVSGEEFENEPRVGGVGLKHIETDTRVVGADTYTIRKYAVERLYMNSFGLNGQLPEFSFDHCIQADLYGNQLSGDIPQMNLPVCTVLLLNNNQFSGLMPDLYLPKLERLELSYNQLTGEFPVLTGMPELKELFVQYNRFTGINESFNHPTLEIWWIWQSSSYKLSGTLPQFDCGKLTELKLNHNAFTGEIPVFNLPECKRIELQNNQLTGNFPDWNMPSLEYLELSNNMLYGEIPLFTGLPVLQQVSLSFNEFTSIAPGFSHPTLTSFVAAMCKLSGGIPAISLPMCERFSVTSNDLSGEIPVFDCPNMMYFGLEDNELTGPIPNFNMPKMEVLRLHDNHLTGSIPDFNMPELTYLDLQNNELSGIIPNFNFPKIDEMELGGNNLEGEIPNFNFPLIRELDLTSNNLSGPIPNFDKMPNLRELFLSYNKLVGPLPGFNLPALKSLQISENMLTGSIPSLNLPMVEQVYLFNNTLTGEIPAWTLPKLKALIIQNNNLEGSFTNLGLPALTGCNIADNQFSSLAHLKSNSPGLTHMQAGKNKFTFEHIEPNLDIQYFLYEEQDSVDHFMESIGPLTRFYVTVGGSANKYQWMKKTGAYWTNIPGATESAYTTNYVQGEVFTCMITNTLATKLTLYSRLAESAKCFMIGVLEFCNESSPWAPGEKNELTANGLIRINDLLVFEGLMTVDSVKLTMKAKGGFYIKDIPLPGGNEIGKFQLAGGEFDLKLMGKEGSITEFGSAALTMLASIAGMDVKLTDMKLVGGRKATGIIVDATVGIPGIVGACHELTPSVKKAEISLKGLMLTKDGISLTGVKAENLGLFVKDFCLEELLFDYISQTNTIRAGAAVRMPFGRVGGGLKLQDGLIDSIAWRVETSKPAFVLGTTTIGIKGFYGKISRITDPAIEVELGGVFSDILSDNFYQVDAGGRTIWPSLFEINGSGKFLKPPLLTLPYQLEAKVAMSYNHPLNMFKVGFDGKMGTEDGKKWLITAVGDYKMSLKYSPPKFAGTISGVMELPKFDNNFPYNWLSSIFTYPIKAETYADFVWGDAQVLHGKASFKTKNRGPFSLQYVIDLSKEFGSEGFLWFDANIGIISLKKKSGIIEETVTEQFSIPDNVEYAIAGLISRENIVSFSLRGPDGSIYTDTTDSDSIFFSTASSGKEGYWTLTSPMAGIWEAIIQNPNENDSLFTFIKTVPVNFEINMEQTGNQVTVTWDNALFEAGGTINLMLDEDNIGFDGFSVAEGFAGTGMLSFELSDSLNLCSFYLFAQVSDSIRTLKAYAANPVTIESSILEAPKFSVDYTKETHILTLSYNDNDDERITGYVFFAHTIDGRDTILAVQNRAEGALEMLVDANRFKTISSKSFDDSGLMGCPSDAIAFAHCEILAQPNVPLNGTVAGGGSFLFGEQVELIATPSYGYQFINWTENGEVVSSEAIYVFIAETDRNLIANFQAITKVAEPVFDNKTMLIFPNPAYRVFHVELPTNVNINRVQVYNTIGQLLMSVNGCSDNTCQVDIYHLNPGIYLIKAITSVGVYTGKFQLLK